MYIERKEMLSEQKGKKSDSTRMYTLAGLKQNPFHVSANPKFFCLTPEHAEALELLIMSIDECAGLNVIYGDYGTGKTTLLAVTAEQYAERPDFCLVGLGTVDVAANEQDFYRRLLTAMGLEGTLGTTLEMRTAIEDFAAHNAIIRKKHMLVLIDEAENLSLPSIDVMRTLINFELQDKKIFHFVLFGQMELAKKLREKPAFVDRINFSYVLNPLSKESLEKAMLFRVKVAALEPDNPPDLFAPDAFPSLFTYSKGFLRRAIIICDMVLKENLSKGTGQITGYQILKTSETLIKFYGQRQSNKF